MAYIRFYDVVNSDVSKGRTEYFVWFAIWLGLILPAQPG